MHPKDHTRAYRIPDTEHTPSVRHRNDTGHRHPCSHGSMHTLECSVSGILYALVWSLGCIILLPLAAPPFLRFQQDTLPHFLHHIKYQFSKSSHFYTTCWEHILWYFRRTMSYMTGSISLWRSSSSSIFCTSLNRRY